MFCFGIRLAKLVDVVAHKGNADLDRARIDAKIDPIPFALKNHRLVRNSVQHVLPDAGPDLLQFLVRRLSDVKHRFL